MGPASRFSNSTPQAVLAMGGAAATAARYAEHRRAVESLRASFAQLPRDVAPRIAKRTSNLFRFRPDGHARLDVSPFEQVLHVDPEQRVADVQGMVTYERLIDATLPYGLMPLVAPQLRTITLGGAVTGLGIESTSFRNGLPHESVREMEVLTGAGDVVVATSENEHAGLFRAFPNSYGTLGYALRLTVELEPVKPYVKLRHLRFDDADAAMRALDEICEQACEQAGHEPTDRDRADLKRTGLKRTEPERVGPASEPVDFLDGVVFSPHEHYLTLGSFVDEAPYVSDYTGMDVYYRSIQQREVDYLTIYDYLWRWDTDWFWCSAAFGLQQPAIRRMWPRRYRRSDVYRRLVAMDRRHGITARIDRLRGRRASEPVIQDVEVPVERAAEFLDFFHREVGISPVWLCPLQLRTVPGEGPSGGDAGSAWPLYPLKPDVRYVNVGFWSSVPLREGQRDGHHNRVIEDEVTRLSGHKSLYSSAFYSSEEFWRLYNGPAYQQAKHAYDPEGRLLDLYDKCVGNR